MSSRENYETKVNNDVEVVSTDVAKPQDNQIYQKIALLDALISPEWNHKSDILGKLLIHYIPILDYVIPNTNIFKLDKPSYRAGNTILHVAKSIGNLELCETFIEIGADFTIKDKYGSPLLNIDIESECSNYFDFKVNRQMPENKKFIEKVFSAHIEFENTNNPSDKNGISHFHMACMYNNSELVKFFLDNGVSVHESVNENSPIYAGFTPLHFAAKYCAIETIELLLNYNADPQLKNSEGLNPLHLLIKEKINTQSQLRRLPAWVIDDPKSFHSSLEISHNKIKKIITLLLKRNTEHGVGTYDDTGLSHFHVICTIEDTSIVENFLDHHQLNLEQKVNEYSALWPGYTALHFAAHFNADTVRLLLRRGADLGAKDSTGVTPFDICLKGMRITDIHSILPLFPAWSNIRFSDGKTRLADFILAMQNSDLFPASWNMDVDDVNTHIPFDSPICAGYTPLHFDVICKKAPRILSSENVDNCFKLQNYAVYEYMYSSRIRRRITEGANAFAQDARGSTPIHLAFNLQEYEIVKSLFKNLKPFPSVVDEHGLSTLHIACATGSWTAVNRFLSLESNVNEATILSYTWSVTNLEAFVDDRKVLYKSIAKGSTPLHIAVIFEFHEIVELLVDNNADILAKDVDGMTPLERSLGTSIFGNVEDTEWDCRDTPMSDGKKRILEILINQVSDLFVDTRPDRMLYCYSLLRDQLLYCLLSKNHESMRKILKSTGITMLHVACLAQKLQQVRELLARGIDVNARIDSTSPLWPGCTPLHILMRRQGFNRIDDRCPKHVEILSLLLKHGADVTETDAIGDTPLHQHFQFYLTSRSNAIFVDMLLDHIVDFGVNPVNAKGLSHLHVACVRDNAAVVEKLLEHGAEINQAVDYFDHIYGGFTALHFAAAFQSEKSVEILLRGGADVHRKDVFGGNPLHAATGENRRPCDGLLQNLIRAGADMELRNVFGEKPIERLMKSNQFTIKEVKVFVEHGCRVNVWNPLSEEGYLAIALRGSETKPIFDTLIEAPKIKSIDRKSRNAIHNVVSYIADWEWFDDEDPTDEVFIPAKKYTESIKTLIELGLDINHQDNQGQTPLHVAAQKQNITGIIGLLNNGANINIVDRYGETAFARSLEVSKLDEMTQLDAKIFATLSAHMFKLKLIRTEISQPNRKVWQEIKAIIPFDITGSQECCKEFESMKFKKIDIYSVTLKDFLSDTGAVSSYPYMLPDQRKAVDEFFGSQSDLLIKEFPNLAYLLLAQYKKATVRIHLIQPAEASIDFLVGFSMPTVCSRIIFKFLSNDVLENLIASMNT